MSWRSLTKIAGFASRSASGSDPLVRCMDPRIWIQSKISRISNTVQNRTLPPPPRHLLPPPPRRKNQAKNAALVPAQREEDQNPRRRREAAGRQAGTASRPAGVCDRRPDGRAVENEGRGRTGPGPSRRMCWPWSDGTRWVDVIKSSFYFSHFFVLVLSFSFSGHILATQFGRFCDIGPGKLLE